MQFHCISYVMYYSYCKVLILALLENGFIYYCMQSRLIWKRTGATCSKKNPWAWPHRDVSISSCLSWTRIKNFVYKYCAAHRHSEPNSGYHPGVLLLKALPLAWFVHSCVVCRTPALQCELGESLRLLITHSSGAISTGSRIQTNLG